MAYFNNTEAAILAMERDRTGDYGNNQGESVKCCPMCGAKNPDYFYRESGGEIAGCCECLARVEWEDVLESEVG